MLVLLSMEEFEFFSFSFLESQLQLEGFLLEVLGIPSRYPLIPCVIPFLLKEALG